MVTPIYNLDAAIIKEIPGGRDTVWYRGQNYPKKSEKTRSPIHFTYNPTRNRWTPVGVETCYFGLDIYTAFLESFPIFREMTRTPRKARTLIGASELKEVEVIQLTVEDDISLVNMSGIGVYQRHPIEPEDILSRDLTIPNAIATEIVKDSRLNVDGIFFETRIGSKESIVIFESSKNSLDKHRILERSSLYDLVIPIRNELEELLYIEIDISI